MQVMRSACLETHEMWCGEFSVRVVIAVVVGVQAAEECRLLLIMRIAPLKRKAIVTAKWSELLVLMDEFFTMWTRLKYWTSRTIRWWAACFDGWFFHCVDLLKDENHYVMSCLFSIGEFSTMWGSLELSIKSPSVSSPILSFSGIHKVRKFY